MLGIDRYTMLGIDWYTMLGIDWHTMPGIVLKETFNPLKTSR